MKNYKDTLLMPHTNFEMRGNLPSKDSYYIQKQLDQKLVKQTKGTKEAFILHDGPPYANGDIHLGHALNKILKDIVVRYNVLKGNKIDWRPGFDTHGLPIEMMVQKKLRLLKGENNEEYLRACKEYALSQVERQQSQFSMLNLLTDWDEKYLTLDASFEKSQIEIFHTMLNKNLVYQDFKPIYWSWSSQTALADAEVEYANKEDPSIYVKFPFKDLNILIWTTTPWTLTANVGLAFGKKIEYGIYKLNDEKVVIAKELKSFLEKEFKETLTFIKDFNVDDSIKEQAKNPLDDQKKSTLVWGHHVTTESGTGIVHIAGGHGLDDHIITKENSLETIVVVDENGHMINAGKFNDLFYLKANKLITESLKENKTLVVENVINHQVTLDWRTKKPVIYRATKQWFVSIKKIKKELLKNIKYSNWIPTWGEKRLSNMMDDRDDWCISRQRLWGVPIPIIYDDGRPLINKELQKNIENLINKEGTNGWRNADIKSLLPKSIKYNSSMKKETDILDVWFDAGSSHHALKIKQADVVIEGNDQYRGWFNSSLVTKTILDNKTPFKNIITHGFILDDKGNKMSKSLGNVIDPSKIIKQYGSDILRLFLANSDYTSNIKVSIEKIKQVTNDYRKIRNSIRFILGNINDFDPNIKIKEKINLMVIQNIDYTFQKVLESYESFQFLHVVKYVTKELTSGSIGYYLDYAKDILYTYSKDDSERKEVVFVLYKALSFILYSLASIMPTTIEEAWEHLKDERADSIFLTTFSSKDKGDNKLWKEFNSIRAVVNKKIEILRDANKIKRSLDASIVLNLPKDLEHWNKPKMNDFLIVAKATVEKSDSKDIAAKATPFIGEKCERCWKVFESDQINDNICKHCESVIKK